MIKLQELQERRVAVSEQLSELGKAGFKTQDDRARFDSLSIEAKELGDDIGRLQTATALNADLRQTQRPPNAPIDPNYQQGKSVMDRLKELKAGDKLRKAERKLTSRQEKAAFRLWAMTGECAQILRSCENQITPDKLETLRRESRDWGTVQGIGAPTASIPTSVFVPQGFVYDVEIALKAYGDFIAAADEIPTATGAPLPYPTSNDTAVEAEIIGEGQTVSDKNVTIGNVVLQAWKYDTKLVPVSLELLQDSAFDMDKFLTNAFAIRLMRGLTRDFTNGSGISCPRGILLDAILGATAVGAKANSGVSTDTDANSIGTTDLLALIHSVDPLYRLNAKFMLHDLTKQILEQTLDKFGRPLYLPNPQSGKLESLFGYPVVINQYMEQIGAASPASPAIPLLFGELKKYKIRKVKDLAVLRLVERAAEQGLVLFIGFARYDGRLVDAGTHPVKYLQMGS